MRPASSPPFDDVLRRLEAELDVPYPQRRELLDEIAADLAAAFAAARDRGLGEAPARAAALAALGLDDAARAALADVHRAPVARLLAALPPRVRAVAEATASAIPLFVLTLYLLLEVPMMDLIREGGWGMYPVLVFGGLAVIGAARRAFRWLIVRDHSVDSLAVDGAVGLQLVLLTFFAGVLGTGTGCYKVLALWSEGQIDGAVAIIGFKESLTVVLLAGVLSVLALLIDTTARAAVHRAGARVTPRP
jgi:hypothetical protein